MSGFTAVNGRTRRLEVTDSYLPGSPGSPGSQQQETSKLRILRPKLDLGHSNFDEELQRHLERVGQALDKGWRLSLALQRKGQRPINEKRKLSERLLNTHEGHKELMRVYKYETKQKYHSRLTTHLNDVQDLIQWIRNTWMSSSRLVKSVSFQNLNNILDVLQDARCQALAECRKRTSDSILPDMGGDSSSDQLPLPLSPPRVMSDNVGTYRTTYREGTSALLGSNNSMGGSAGESLADRSAQWQRSMNVIQATLAELSARLSARISAPPTLRPTGIGSTRQ